MEVPIGSLMGARALSLGPEEPIEEVRRLMRDHGVRVVAVVSDGKLLGIVERASVLQVSATKSEARAKDLMIVPKVTLEPSIPLREAVKTLLRAEEWYAPVVDRGTFKAFFGLEDAIDYALRSRSEALRVPLSDIMTKEPVVVKESDPISKVWKLMVELRFAGLPVVNEKGALVGMVTQYDLLKKGYSRIHLESSGGPAKMTKVRTVMTRPCTFLTGNRTALEAASIMINRNIGRIPIADGERTRRPIGVVDREDIARLLI